MVPSPRLNGGVATTRHDSSHASPSIHSGGGVSLSAPMASSSMGLHTPAPPMTLPPRLKGPVLVPSSKPRLAEPRPMGRPMEGSEGYANDSPTHPLDPLSASEVREAGLLAGRALSDGQLEPLWALRVSEVGLQEPDKQLVTRFLGLSRADAFRQGMHRLARVLCYSASSGRAYSVMVDLSTGLHNITKLPPIQPRFGPDDYETCEAVVRGFVPFREAMAKAGYDPDRVMIDPWSMGYFGVSDGPERRLCWALMYYKEREEDNTYARPVEGLKIVVDLLNKEVAEFGVVCGYEGGVVVAAPDEPRYMNYTPTSQQRTDLKDLVILQPDGPSFSLQGRHLTWQGWSMRIGFTPQEGLVLHMVSYTDRYKDPSMGPLVRPILYRLSFAEMVVPYGDPLYPHYKKNAFDGGEDGLGTNAHSLSLGCDCLGHIHYLDAHLGPTRPGGEASVIRQAICVHEEDGGVLWKHKDWRTDTAQVRRNRRLVLSFMCTIGNYDYGFYYHLSLDGTMEMEVRLTGILSVGSLQPSDMTGHRPYGTTLHTHSHDPRMPEGGGGGGLFAPSHQHIFCARMDMAVDGPRNRVVEVNSFKRPLGASDNPHASAWVTEETVLPSELKAMRDADLHQERFWLVQSSEHQNRTGKPTAFKLVARDPITVMAHPNAAFMRRAGYTLHTLWATRYHPDERFPAGEYPNQDPTVDAGLPQWAQQDRPLVDEDVVLWHVFGAHHIPRLEDWPLMPAERVSCVLKPFGFFDACPVMDVAPSSKRQLRLSTSNNNAHMTTTQQQQQQQQQQGGGSDEGVLVQGGGGGGGGSSGEPCCASNGSQGAEGLVLKSRL